MPPTETGSRRYVAQVDLFAVTLQREHENSPAVLQIPLLPEGTFEHEWYGLLHWTPEKFREMQRNFDARVTGFQPMLNADHATHNPFAGSAPAYGWLTALVVRDGEGLDALVELTDLGEEAIRNRRYRYISAEVADSWDNAQGDTFANVVVGAALTNVPFHGTMRGLFSQEPQAARCFSNVGPASFWAARDGDQTRPDRSAGTPAKGDEGMNLIDWVRQRFSLPASATEADAVAALSAAVPAPEAERGNPPAAGDMSTTSSSTELVTLRQELDTLRATTAALQATVQQHAQNAQTAQDTLRRRDAEALIDRFQREGKITPAMRQAMINGQATDPIFDLALADPARFEAIYSAAPVVVDTRAYGRSGEPDASGGGGSGFMVMLSAVMKQNPALSPSEAAEQVVRDHPEAYAAYRARRTN